jgi:hypothetical protein
LTSVTPAARSRREEYERMRRDIQTEREAFRSFAVLDVTVKTLLNAANLW